MTTRAASPLSPGESMAGTPRRTGGIRSVQGGGSGVLRTPIGGRASPSQGKKASVGRSSPSPGKTVVSRSSLANTPKNSEDTPQRIVLISTQDKKTLCFGVVGSKSRFCVAPRDGGYTHCGVKAHKKGHKFIPIANCYYAPGGMNSGKPTARFDNWIPVDRVPDHMKSQFEDS